jgi:hypothetical protein
MPNEPLIASRHERRAEKSICDDAQTLRVSSENRARECEGPRGWKAHAERSQCVRCPENHRGVETPLHGRSQRQGTGRGSELRMCSCARRQGERRTEGRAEPWISRAETHLGFEMSFGFSPARSFWFRSALLARRTRGSMSWRRSPPVCARFAMSTYEKCMNARVVVMRHVGAFL